LLRGFFTEAGSAGGFLTGSARRVIRLALELEVRADALDRAASFFLVVRGRLVVDIQCPSSLSPPAQPNQPNQIPTGGARPEASLNQDRSAWTNNQHSRHTSARPKEKIRAELRDITTHHGQ
jgi:hypothetical protein